MMKWLQKRHIKKDGKENQRGQGMVEFALALPIFLILIVGVIEFGYFFFVYSMTNAAVREATRYGAASGISENGVPYFQDCQGMMDAAIRIGGLSGITSDNVDVTYEVGPVGGPYDDTGYPKTCVIGTPTEYEEGMRVSVNISTIYYPILFRGIFPDIPINVHASRTLVQDISIE